MSPNNPMLLEYPVKGETGCQVATSASLQDAFRKFRDKRKTEILAAKDHSKQRRPKSPQTQLRLRKLFLHQVKKYIGIPYAKKYHDKGSPDYNSKLFLDCCGLIRRVLKDLRNDFEFTIGSWNQAYMFDTLPISLKEEDMKPGDLVFISGSYFDNNRRKQIHDMVHVEVWLGEGEKTIGARWHRGRVQIHDSYKFVSKSYYNMEYHFKSIETWLEGVCRSFCPEHPWKRRPSLKHGKKSVFTVTDEMPTEHQQSDSDNYSEMTETKGPSTPCDLYPKDKMISKTESDARSNDSTEDSILLETRRDDNRICHGNCNHQQSQQQSINSFSGGHTLCMESLATSFPLLDSGIIEPKSCQCKDKPDLGVPRLTDHAFVNNPDDNAACELSEKSSDDDFTFQEFIMEDGNNCTSAFTYESDIDVKFRSCPTDEPKPKVRNAKTQRSKAERRDRAQQSKLRQATSPSHSGTPQSITRQRPEERRINEKTFYIGGHNGNLLSVTELMRISPSVSYVNLDVLVVPTPPRSQQMVNHIPNGGVLTSKSGLRRSLEEYERVLRRISSGQPSPQLCLRDFYPETYGISGVSELKRFGEVFQDGEVWICKPSGMNQGKGIFLVNSVEFLAEKLEKLRKKPRKHHSERIIQRYIRNPLLLDGHKFDIRAYMLIASTIPYMVYYHKGYVRLSCVPFAVESQDIHAHLTNQYIQKRHPSYQEKKEDTVWSFERFNEYINDNVAAEKKLALDWAFTDLTHRMKDIMLTCFKAAQNKLERRHGFFDLLGFDFMIDDNMKIWLIEINVNPALHTNCQTLRNLLPGLIDETLRICIELFEKKKHKRRLRPVEALKNFEIIYNGETDTTFKQRRKCAGLRSRAENTCDASKELAIPSDSHLDQAKSLPNLGNPETKAENCLLEDFGNVSLTNPEDGAQSSYNVS